MRNNGRLFLLFLLLAAGGCEANEAKEAFDAYERAVEPILDREERIRLEFRDEVDDAMTYGRDEEMMPLVEKRLLPFYRKMEEEVAAAAPEGAELSRVHSLLVRYAELRRRFFETYLAFGRAAESRAEKIRPFRLEVEAARSGVDHNATKLNEAAGAAPKEFLTRLSTLFSRDGESRQVVSQMVAGLEQGVLEGDRFRQFVETQIRPYYEGLAKQLEGMETDENGRPMLDAAKAYVSSVTKLLDATLKLADHAGGDALPEEADPRQLQGLQTEAAETLEAFRSEAKTYREGLR